MQPEQPINPTEQPAPAPSVPEAPESFAPQVPAAPVEPVYAGASVPSGEPVVYESNPFRAAVTGLVTILKVNPISALLSSIFPLLPLAILVVITLVLMAISKPLGTFVAFVGYILLIPLYAGASVQLASRSIEGETVGIVQLYKDTLPKLLPLLGATILIILAVSIGFVLLIVPGIIALAWFSLTYFVMFDENLGPIAAMKRSRELVKGHIWEMIGASFAAQFMSGGGLLGQAAGIAPLSARYQQLKALKASGQPKPKVHWLNFIGPVLLALYLALVIGLVVYGVNHSKTTNNGSNSTTNLLDTTSGSNSPYNNLYSN